MDIHDGSDGLAEFSFEYVCKSRASSSSSEPSTQEEIDELVRSCLDESSIDIPIEEKYREPYTQKQIEELTDALIKELTLSREHVKSMEYLREKDKSKKDTRCVIS